MVLLSDRVTTQGSYSDKEYKHVYESSKKDNYDGENNNIQL